MAGLSLSSCYVIKQGYTHLSLMSTTEEINTFIKKKSTTEKMKSKLQAVQSAQKFAVEKMGLKASEDFKEVLMLPGPHLTHLLFVAHQDKLELKKWWFPIVGSFKYKGFYHKEDALAEQREFEEQGFETYLTTASSFSGLGYFATPFTSNLFKYSPLTLVGIILHELAHGTYFVPGHTHFNESFATFVEKQGILDFINGGYLQNLKLQQSPNTIQSNYLKRREKRKKLKQNLSELIKNLRKVYKSDIEPLKKRTILFDEFRKQNEQEFSYYFKKPLNNARILATSLYNPDHSLFRELLKKENSWPRFLKVIGELSNCERFDQKGPFVALQDFLSDQCSQN